MALRKHFLIGAVAGATLALASCSYVPAPPKGLPDRWEPTPTPSTVPSQQAESEMGFNPGERATARVGWDDCEYYYDANGVILDAYTIVTTDAIATNATSYVISLVDGTTVTVSKVLVDTKSDLAFIKTNERMNGSAIISDTDPSAGDSVTAYGYFDGGALRSSIYNIREGAPDPNDASAVVYSALAPYSNVNGVGVYNDEDQLVGIFYVADDADDTSDADVIPASTVQAANNDSSRLEDQPLAKCS